MNTKQPFDPKEILNSIELPDDLDRLIGDSVEKGYERMRRKTKIKKVSMVRRAAVIAGIIEMCIRDRCRIYKGIRPIRIFTPSGISPEIPLSAV